MTREIARRIIDDLDCYLLNHTNDYSECSHEAMMMAVKALEQEPKIGHWVEENINGWSRKIFCSECGCPPPFEYISSGDVYSAKVYGVINKAKYCPNCGTKMQEAEE